MSLANNIRFLRKQKGMSQEQLADYLNYKSYTTIQKWESGVSEPPFKQLKRMADLFGVDIDDMASVDMESGVRPDGQPTGYYLNQETAEIAQKIFENKELRVLFDAARDARPDDLKTAYDVLLALKRKEEYSGDDPA